MRRRWHAGVLAIATVASAAACRDLLGLHEPIVEDEGGAGASYPAFKPHVPQLLAAKPVEVIGLPQIRGFGFPGVSTDGGLSEAAALWFASDIWLTQTAEYSVLHPVAVPPVLLTEVAPATLTDGDVQAWLAAKLDGTHAEFGSVDATTLASEVFFLQYPPGTTITAPGGVSCQDFRSYHGELPLDTLRRTAYLVLPTCDSSTATLSIAGSYAVLATVTNPRPVSQPGYASFDDEHRAWNFLNGDGGTEIPQPCMDQPPVPLPESGLPISRSWSNLAMSGYHDPCVPAPDSTPYFVSVPVMNDDVSLPGAYPTKGIQLAVGTSKVVDVQLLSDAPTSGPWTVDASVLPPFPPGALGFAFDKPTGSNGDTLHLTVTAKQAGPPIPFAITSTLGSHHTTWVGIVGQQ